MLVDSHCHLDFPDFADDLDDVLERAADNGVKQMLTIGTKLSTFQDTLAVARRYEHVYCSVGIHPHEAEREAPMGSIDVLGSRAGHEKVVGIGETGLDFHYEHSPKAIQEDIFRRHIVVSRETGLPIIVHTRDADDATIRILRDEHKKGAFPGLIHCFSTGRKVAEAALELGFYISISGIVTFKAAGELRDIVSTLPLERLLVETDSPYLAPVPCRGRRNEPAFATHTAAKVAELQKVDFETFAKVTTDNFYRLFAKAKRPGDNGLDS